MDIVQFLLDESEVSGVFEAPMYVRVGLISSTFTDGDFSSERIFSALSALERKPNQFWKLAAAVAANIRDPMAESIISSLEDFVSKRPEQQALAKITTRLREALQTSSLA